MSDATTHERLAAWLDGEAALYRERAQRAEDAQDWDPAVRYAGAADALVQLRDRVLLGEQIGPSPVMREALSSAWDKASESHTFPTSRPDEESAALRSGAQGEDELAALVVHMWQLKEQRGPMYTESGDFYVDFHRAYQLAAARTNGGSDG